MYTKLIEYIGSGTTSYVYSLANSVIFVFSPGPGTMVKTCSIEWRIGKGSVSNPEQRTRYRGPMEETYTLTGILPQTGDNSAQLLEDLSKRNSKYRLETLLTSPTPNGADTTLTEDAAIPTSTIKVASSTLFAIGDFLQIDTGMDKEEIRRVLTKPDSTHIELNKVLDKVHSSGAMVKEIEGVFCVVNSLELNQQQVKMSEAAGDSQQYIPFTLKLTRIRDDNCSGE